MASSAAGRSGRAAASIALNLAGAHCLLTRSGDHVGLTFTGLRATVTPTPVAEAHRARARYAARPASAHEQRQFPGVRVAAATRHVLACLGASRQRSSLIESAS